jgi:hypothetical protein
MGGNTEIVNSVQKAEGVRFQASQQGLAVPVLYGANRVPPNLLDYGNFQAIEQRSTESAGGKGGGGVDTTSVTYRYTASVVMGLVEGPIQQIGRIWRGKTMIEAGGPLICSANYIKVGNITSQSPPALLSTLHGGAHALVYSGMALFTIEDYDLGADAQIENHSIEVYGPGCQGIDSSILDANPSLPFVDWVENTRRGLGLSGLTGPVASYRNFCTASGLWLSPMLLEQAPATDRLELLQRITNSAMVEVDGQLHMVPLGTEAVSMQVGGVTYSWAPDLTPMYALTPDHLMSTGDDEPLVSITRKPPADVFNVVEVGFRNRSNEYAPDVARVVDQASISMFGERAAPKLDCEWICDPSVALRIAQQELNRHGQVRNEYAFRLPWPFADLLPTNIVTLTSPGQGLEDFPVQIKRMEETDAGYEFTAVDFTATVSAQPAHQLPVANPYRNDFSAAPGNTVLKAVFEGPKELTNGDLELWLAVDGASDTWGGCHVWVSLNGVDYQKVTTITGRTRAGVLSAAMLSSDSAMSLSGVNGQLLSASGLAAGLGETLCYIGGASPEFVAYTTASLTAAGAYTLSGVIRGIYEGRTAAHFSGAPVVRCDQSVGRYGPLNYKLIGQQVHIKCQSFNIYGVATQDLAVVADNTYTITGRYVLTAQTPENLLSQGSFDLLPLGERPSEWSAGVVAAVSGRSFARYLKVSPGGCSGVVPVYCEPGVDYYVSAQVDASAASTAGDWVSLFVDWLDGNGATLSSGLVALVPTVSGGTWRSVAKKMTAPAGAARMVPRLGYSASVPVPSGSTLAALYAGLADVRMVRQAQTQELADHSATEVFSGFLASATTSYFRTPDLVSTVNGPVHVLIHLSFDWVAANTNNITYRLASDVRGYVDSSFDDGSFGQVNYINSQALSALILGTLAPYETKSGRLTKTMEAEVVSGTHLQMGVLCSDRVAISGAPYFSSALSNISYVVEVVKK